MGGADPNPAPSYPHFLTQGRPRPPGHPRTHPGGRPGGSHRGRLRCGRPQGPSGRGLGSLCVVTPTTGEAGWAAEPMEQRGGGPGQAAFPNLPRWIPHTDPEDSPLPGLRRQETDPQTEARVAGAARAGKKRLLARRLPGSCGRRRRLARRQRRSRVARTP